MSRHQLFTHAKDWLVILLMTALASTVAAQDQAPEDDEDETPPAAEQEEPTEEQGEPSDESTNPETEQDDVDDSLDDLLGLEEDDAGRSAREAAEAESQQELESALREQKAIDDAFLEAIEKMSLSANLLGDKFDSGLGTQRVQEEIIAKLDVLIQAARNQQNNSNSSSSSSASQQQSQPQQVRRQQQNQPQQGENTQQRNPNPANSSSEYLPTDPVEMEINEILAETDVEWGALPERKRDQLMQAMNDKPSSLYRKLTYEYFRRISDESSR